jgi:hypothetical protein
MGEPDSVSSEQDFALLLSSNVDSPPTCLKEKQNNSELDIMAQLSHQQLAQGGFSVSTFPLMKMVGKAYNGAQSMLKASINDAPGSGFHDT